MDHSVLGLGTSQRNLASAMVVAEQNFSSDPNVLTFILVTDLLGLVVLMLIGGELGRRSQTEAATS
jgi:BASS family bile acid:Na+ symporter